MTLPLVLGKGTKTLLVLALLVIVGAGLRAAASLVVPLLVAAFVAASAQPLVDYLENRGLPTFVAVTLTMLAAAACVVGFGALVVVAAGELAESMPTYERAIGRVKSQTAVWLAAHGLSRGAAAVASFDIGATVEGWLAEAALATPALASVAGVVLFVLIFALLEVASFRRKMRRGLHWVPAQFEHFRHAVDDVKKYLLVKTALSVVTGVACGGICWAFGLDGAPLWGLIAFVLNYIPNIGGVIAAVPPLVLAVIELGVGRALGIATGFFLLHNLIGNLLEPKIMGRALGLSPLAVLLSVIIWGWLLGPIGAVFSVPLTMTLKLWCANTEDLRWIAVLLGSGDGSEEEEYIVERARQRKSRASNARHSVENHIPV